MHFQNVYFLFPCPYLQSRGVSVNAGVMVVVSCSGKGKGVKD